MGDTNEKPCHKKKGCKISNVLAGYDKITHMAFSRDENYIWVGSEFGHLKQVEIFISHKQIDHSIKLNGEEITVIEPSLYSNHLFIGNGRGYILKYDFVSRQDILIWNLLPDNLFDLNVIQNKYIENIEESDNYEKIVDVMVSNNDQF